MRREEASESESENKCLLLSFLPSLSPPLCPHLSHHQRRPGHQHESGKRQGAPIGALKLPAAAAGDAAATTCVERLHSFFARRDDGEGSTPKSKKGTKPRAFFPWQLRPRDRAKLRDSDESRRVGALERRDGAPRAFGSGKESRNGRGCRRALNLLLLLL